MNIKIKIKLITKYIVSSLNKLVVNYRKINELKKHDRNFGKYTDSDYHKQIHNYWKNLHHIDFDWHDWYSRINGIKDPRYIPENTFYNYILPSLNNIELTEAFSDKAFTSVFYNKVKLPNVVCKNINGLFFDDNFNLLDVDKVIAKCMEQDEIVIKPTIESGAGRGITFMVIKKNDNFTKKLKETLNNYKENFIIQEIVEQHEELKKLNPHSVNTIRVMSYLDEKGVHVLSSHIRIGTQEKKVDHFGIVVGINPKGYLMDFGVIYKEGIKIKEHPDGYGFKGVKVPNFSGLLKQISNLHLSVPHFRIVSWDFTVDNQNIPVLIEANIRFPGINHHQLLTGPLFGELTQEILEEVF